MKVLKFLLLSLFFISCNSFQNVQKLPSKYHYRYEIESGHVVYSISGIKKGSEELFFDQYGARQSKLTKNKISIGTNAREISTLTIYQKDSVFMINLNDSIGRALKDEYLFIVADSLNTLDLTKAQLFLMQNEQGLQKIAKEKILNKECDVYQLPDSSLQMWLWNNIPLKIESSIMGIKNTVVAIRIQAGLSIPKNKFIIPDGIEF